MEKPVIEQIIVVEGRDDTTAIRRAVIADTIETNGSAVNKETIEKVRLAVQKRGVIILTDPDFPGEKIRKTVDQAVPFCSHAFISKKDALPERGKGLGVEHASVEVIREALRNFHSTKRTETTQSIPQRALIEYGLLGGTHAKTRRMKLGELLKIGYANGKQLSARLKAFQISDSAFKEAIEKVIQEEKHD
ncbi:ribonuclease M5 [Listeria sp. PSOL-1]|uniref:ribonuclease M5 n=1 Tax=Listeria sp. PSOL-1 TaxID=1844999 RepID=UPI0013D500D2|nr:ribonuclease M5 [Listeria sp. PSOL-1]